MTGPGDTTPTRLILVRHGESVVTVNRVIGGFRSCSGLSDLGIRQAERLRDRIAATGEPVADVLVSSDFERAVETAEIIQPALGAAVAGPFERRGEFGEHDPGPELDGTTFDEYVDRFGTPDWTSDPHAEVFPGGGETVFEFHTRVTTATDELLARHAGRCVVVACHGGVVDAVLRHLLGLPMTGGFELQTSNTAMTEFVDTGRDVWRLDRYNDAAHLAGLPEATPRRTAGAARQEE